MYLYCAGILVTALRIVLQIGNMVPPHFGSSQFEFGLAIGEAWSAKKYVRMCRFIKSERTRSTLAHAGMHEYVP